MNNIEHRVDNRHILILCSDEDTNHIQTPHQTHSNIWTHSEHKAQEADAIWTKSGKPIGVRTADCCPILIWDPHSDLNIAIHAGWRGLATGVIDRIINQPFYQPNKFKAYIGPTICQNHYEVSSPMLDTFREHKHHDFSPAIHHECGRTYFDIAGAVHRLLIKLGITPINTAICNRCHNMPSYRRNQTTQRIISSIAVFRGNNECQP